MKLSDIVFNSDIYIRTDIMFTDIGLFIITYYPVATKQYDVWGYLYNLEDIKSGNTKNVIGIDKSLTKKELIEFIEPINECKYINQKEYIHTNLYDFILNIDTTDDGI